MVDTVPIPASMYTDIEMLTFYTGLNTGSIDHVPVDFKHYRSVPGVKAGTKKKAYIYFFFIFSFVIFEFL